MSKRENQHYIPRMYMKRFGYGLLKKEKISVLKKQENIILDNQRVENFAAQRFFYDTSREKLGVNLEELFLLYPEAKNTVNLAGTQFVEHMFNREETAINDLLNSLDEDLSAIRKEENIAMMIEFLHSMAYRTRSFRETIENINSDTAKAIGQICDNLGLSEEVKRTEIERHCQSGKDTQLQQLLSFSAVFQTMRKLIENYDWYEAYNNTQLDLIIGDDPFRTIIMGFNDICVPISHSKAIVLKAKENDGFSISENSPINGVIQLSLSDVIAYNTYQLEMAQYYVFGTKKAIRCMKLINDYIIYHTGLQQQ